jgi:hypothetical protein
MTVRNAIGARPGPFSAHHRLTRTLDVGQACRRSNTRKVGTFAGTDGYFFGHKLRFDRMIAHRRFVKANLAKYCRTRIR